MVSQEQEYQMWTKIGILPFKLDGMAKMSLRGSLNNEWKILGKRSSIYRHEFIWIPHPTKYKF